jgi:hypothetical protein
MKKNRLTQQMLDIHRKDVKMDIPSSRGFNRSIINEFQTDSVYAYAQYME